MRAATAEGPGQRWSHGLRLLAAVTVRGSRWLGTLTRILVSRDSTGVPWLVALPEAKQILGESHCSVDHLVQPRSSRNKDPH